MSDTIITVDALPPREIAERVAEVGVRKARTAPVITFVQGVLAGGFVSLGALFATVVTTGASDVLPYGLVRLLFGLTFCLGLILVVLAGAELFTGNNLIVVAVASRRVSLGALLRNWAIVYSGNVVGGIGTAALIFLSGEYRFGEGGIGQAALSIAAHKTHIDFAQALVLGIFCNALVCMAIWLTQGGRSMADKILVILFPITAFSAAGFEHSIANAYFIPIGLFIRQFDPAFAAASSADLSGLTWAGFANNMLPVTLGNIVGGVVMVALIYWFVYLRPRDHVPAPRSTKGLG